MLQAGAALISVTTPGKTHRQVAVSQLAGGNSHRSGQPERISDAVLSNHLASVSQIAPGQAQHMRVRATGQPGGARIVGIVETATRP